jgi:hypothetical protein
MLIMPLLASFSAGHRLPEALDIELSPHHLQRAQC